MKFRDRNEFLIFLACYVSSSSRSPWFTSRACYTARRIKCGVFIAYREFVHYSVTACFSGSSYTRRLLVLIHFQFILFFSWRDTDFHAHANKRSKTTVSYHLSFWFLNGTPVGKSSERKELRQEEIRRAPFFWEWGGGLRAD